jgi:hypothetical protein
VVQASCTLPGGLVVGDGRTVREADLRPLTGKEEEWLASQPSAPIAHAVTRLLGGCLLRVESAPGSVDLARRLLVADREYLMLQLRRMTFGDTIGLVAGCPVCAARMDVDVPAAEVPVVYRPQAAATYERALAAGDGRTRTVHFRLPTGADQEAVAHLAGLAAVDALMERCVLDDGGLPLTVAERQEVEDAMEELAPHLDVELDLTCPECGHAFTLPFDVPAFFIAELRRHGRHLLAEVHTLALYYHWSEAAILRLTQTRRRAYLGLLSEALARE